MRRGNIPNNYLHLGCNCVCQSITFGETKMDPPECEMTHFLKQFTPKGTTKNTEWAKRLCQSYAVRKNKNTGSSAIK